MQKQESDNMTAIVALQLQVLKIEKLLKATDKAIGD